MSPSPDALHDAARRGDLDRLNRLLAEGANVNTRDSATLTPLMVAASADQEAIVRCLLKFGAQLDAEKSDGSTALSLAVAAGATSVVRLLLARGARTAIVERVDVSKMMTSEEWADLDKLRAMHRAIAEERGAEALAQFKQQRSLTDFVRGVQESPVSLIALAIRSGNPAMLRILLEAGLKPEPLPDRHTAHPITCAIQKNNIEMVRLLLEFGADPNYGAATSLLHDALWGRKRDIAELLLQAGADPNRGFGPAPHLAFAIMQQDMETIDLLLKYGARIDTYAPLRNILEMNPQIRKHIWQRLGIDWHDSVKAGEMEAVRQRLEAGVDINVRGERNWTALMVASDQGFPDMVRLLLQAGADLRVQNEWKQTPIVLAARNGHRECVAVLREAGALYGLSEAAACGDRTIVEQILQRGTPVDYTEESGMTALMAASARGDLELIERLLESGASLTAQDSKGETPLYYAVHFTQIAAAELLLQRGADVNIRNAQQETLVELATTPERISLLGLFLAHGAHIEDKVLVSLLSPPSAVKAKYSVQEIESLLALLLENGGNPSAQRVDEKTLLHIALDIEAPLSTLQLIIRHGADVNRSWGSFAPPLIDQIISRDSERALLLLDAGADPNTGDDGISAYDIAIAQGDMELAEKLAASGGKPSKWLARFGFGPEKKQEMLRRHVPQSSKDATQEVTA